MVFYKEPSIWANSQVANNKLCIECKTAGGNMDKCTLCSSTTACSKCGGSPITFLLWNKTGCTSDCANDPGTYTDSTTDA